MTKCSIVDVNGKFQVSEVTILESRPSALTEYANDIDRLLGVVRQTQADEIRETVRFVDIERRNAKRSRRNARRQRIAEKEACPGWE
jgi:hypothetical protein